MRIAFWNNKGGVGKTFLCFATASEYAQQRPGVKVVVMDMCPQANVSEILLGGNGGGGEELQKLLVKLPVAQTIGGYYHQRILQPHSRTGTETDFLIRVRDSNPRAPDNLYLVAGDPSLEFTGPDNQQHRRSGHSAPRMAQRAFLGHRSAAGSELALRRVRILHRLQSELFFITRNRRFLPPNGWSCHAPQTVRRHARSVTSANWSMGTASRRSTGTRASVPVRKRFR